MGSITYTIIGATGVRESLMRMLSTERLVNPRLKRDQLRQQGILQGLGMALQSADIAVRCEEEGKGVVSRDVNTIMDEFRRCNDGSP
jgi:hypothetical protein